MLNLFQHLQTGEIPKQSDRDNTSGRVRNDKIYHTFCNTTEIGSFFPKNMYRRKFFFIFVALPRLVQKLVEVFVGSEQFFLKCAFVEFLVEIRHFSVNFNHKPTPEPFQSVLAVTERTKRNFHSYFCWHQNTHSNFGTNRQISHKKRPPEKSDSLF